MKCLVLVLSILSVSYGYKILGIFPVPSRSHGLLAKGIVDALLNAGHEVTWVSPFTDWKTHKNLKLVDVSDTIKLVEGIDMTQQRDELNFVKEFAKNITTITNKNQRLRELVTRENFDAVVTEWFFSDTDAGYAAVQQAPWIMLNGMVLHPHVEGLVDEVRSISTIPMMMFDFPMPMTFWQRLLNTFTYISMTASMKLEESSTAARYESQFASLANARRVQLPPFSEAVNNVSILLVNSHPSIASALSLPPNVIDIAGYHIDEAQPLPKDIQAILDSSPQGVVYFSMGSVLKSSKLPAHTRKDLIEMLGSVPYTVLWKFEEDIQGLPKNIVARKWWPQASVLAHPNVRLFITHGGMLSTLEAIHYGVPLLAVPVFGDQPNNAQRAVRSGYALSVPYNPDMGPELKVALNKMLNDDSYYKQAKFLSKLFNNRPVPPSKLISHYIELAIESKGANHLRSKTFLYSWYQRWMVDQLAFVLLVLYIVYAAARRIICKLFCGEKTKEVKKKVKKN